MTAESHTSETPTIDVTVDAASDQVTAVVEGRVDHTNVGVLRTALLDLLDGSVHRLVIDLTDAELLDPTAAAALVHVNADAAHHGVKVGIAVAPGSVTEATLARCGVLRALPAREVAAGLPGHW